VLKHFLIPWIILENNNMVYICAGKSKINLQWGIEILSTTEIYCAQMSCHSNILIYYRYHQFKQTNQILYIEYRINHFPWNRAICLISGKIRRCTDSLYEVWIECIFPEIGQFAWFQGRLDRWECQHCVFYHERYQNMDAIQ
jgi:hypothetical protein